MKSPYVFTPGPTSVRENVRLARAQQCTNPDLDLQFYDFYKGTCEKIGKIIKTSNPIYILSGEGILGLDSACASLTEEGDRVLVIDNGVFGAGFADFVKIYGGKPVTYKSDTTKDINIDDLRRFLEKDSDFKYATIVHCDTPSGLLNNIDKVCPLLKEFNILTVVDTVASMGGEDIRVDEWKIDIALGASQKVLSAQPGLTIVSISEEALRVMENRKKPIMGFYNNLTIWKNYYKEKWFPYTMPISDIVSLDVALDNILNEGTENVIKRHYKYGNAVRKAILEYGLELFIEKGQANTITAVKIPEFIGCDKLIKHMLEEYNVLIAGSFSYMSGKVIRIGHMGENADKDKLTYLLSILEKSLMDLGYNKKNKSLVEEFLKNL
ncbi:pyridoxal-phosphate-dependent aminotransferase family protein [Clostridium senegalense]|uniref:Alanine--glyoxylate aminotransferase family protein n=1 Tax=Clostridium senegalense TaxID=1465809 RepID=A0A6M0H8B2_9CLOT|nr:alanine--glyoxylate aminotransferase family protein [Clostridium senegalense]NEU06638.1 alanine--glyoxylate aminotransferase family protein [Clostridium senegalense]